MRAFWVALHRYAGLTIAFFVIVAGLTGSILAFHHELDGLLNADTYRVSRPANARPIDAVAAYELASARSPGRLITSLSLSAPHDPDRRMSVWSQPIPDADGHAADDGYSILINRYDGTFIRQPQTDLWPVTRQNLMQVIYLAHYSLLVPGDWGVWAMGIAAVIWTVDCFVGLYLTFPPNGQRRGGAKAAGNRLAGWLKAFKVRWRAGGYKMNFDLHRAGGLWFWLLFLIMAWSSVALNLDAQVYQPAMSAMFEMRPAYGGPPPLDKPLFNPPINLPDAVERARSLVKAKARSEGFEFKADGQISYSPSNAIYYYRFRSNIDLRPDYGTVLIFSGIDGRPLHWMLGRREPAGDQITLFITGLHMARLGGLPVQILICVSGLVAAMLSATGLVIWWRKRKARNAKKHKARGASSRRLHSSGAEIDVIASPPKMQRLKI